MLLIARDQWDEVFNRLQWGEELAAQLWGRMGGGARHQLDWPDVYRLVVATGWSEKHAQVLWLTLNNFVQPPTEATPEPEAKPVEETIPEPEPQVVPLAPAPWERAAAVYSGQVDDIPVVQPSKSKRGIELKLPALPSFLAEIDRRLLALLAVVLVGAVGFLVLSGGGSDNSSPSGSSSTTPAPSANVLQYRGIIQTYFSWKTPNPAMQLCLMTKGCTTPQLNSRIKEAGVAGQQAGVRMYQRIGKNYKQATFREMSNGTVQVTIPASQGSYCGTMVKEGGSWKIVAANDYAWTNLLLGTSWKPCSS